MIHEEILKPHISSINYMGLVLQVVIKDDALKAMAEAVEEKDIEMRQYIKTAESLSHKHKYLVDEVFYLREQLAAKDKEIEKWEDTLKNLKHRINEHYGGGFTDEDIALAHYKRRCEEQDKEIAELKNERDCYQEACDWYEGSTKARNPSEIFETMKSQQP